MQQKQKVYGNDEVGAMCWESFKKFEKMIILLYFVENGFLNIKWIFDTVFGVQFVQQRAEQARQ